MTIYAELGFDGVEICGAANTISIGTMSCESGYGTTCNIDQSSPNQCSPSTSCDDASLTMSCIVPAPTAPPIPTPGIFKNIFFCFLIFL